MNSIANQLFVKGFAEKLAAEISRSTKGKRPSEWTRSVYEVLKGLSQQYGWSINPPDKAYAGEYLCDFTLHEPGYGCRLACESQWMHWGDHQKALDWAFDKLRGVKSDIKLFIFEAEDEQWRKTVENYLLGYAQITTDEAFVALQWDGTHQVFLKSWWKPKVNGVQKQPIVFECL